MAQHPTVFVTALQKLFQPTTIKKLISLAPLQEILQDRENFDEQLLVSREKTRDVIRIADNLRMLKEEFDLRDYVTRY